MATRAPAFTSERRDAFFPISALIMAAIVVLAFSTHALMGRSSFAAPALWHMHGIAFMGWVGLFVAQSVTGTTRSLTLHRRLGWLGAAWSLLLVVMGCALTLRVVRDGTAPFFFQPQYFLIANPLSVFVFAGLTAAAIRMRRRTDWHARLHLCGMAMLMGPAFGRLLPSPFLGFYAFQIAVVTGLAFPVAGMVRDYRRSGRAHPAWIYGVGGALAVLLVAQIIAFSPVGDAAYAAATQGAGGASIEGRVAGKPPLP